MTFDVVIGNPPFNNGADIDFVFRSFEISNKLVCMITPAKWQTAEGNQLIDSKNSYESFRNIIVKHMKYICYYPDCKELFDIMQTDGITYYIIDKTKNYDKTYIENKCKTQKLFNSKPVKRDITNGRPLFNIGETLLRHLEQNTGFEIDHGFKISELNKIGRYQVWINTKTPGGGFVALSEQSNNILVIGFTRIIDTENNEKCPVSDAKMVYAADSIEQCNNFISWMHSKFVRFLVMINISKLSKILTDHYFRFVPLPLWDKQLEFKEEVSEDKIYEAFKIDDAMRDIIESTIKSRE